MNEEKETFTEIEVTEENKAEVEALYGVIPEDIPEAPIYEEEGE